MSIMNDNKISLDDTQLGRLVNYLNTCDGKDLKSIVSNINNAKYIAAVYDPVDYCFYISLRDRLGLISGYHTLSSKNDIDMQKIERYVFYSEHRVD